MKFCDEKDKIVILKSWMKSRPVAANVRAINFTDVNNEKNLEEGTTKKYIEQVAKELNYFVDRDDLFQRHAFTQLRLLEDGRDGFGIGHAREFYENGAWGWFHAAVREYSLESFLCQLPRGLSFFV